MTPTDLIKLALKAVRVLGQGQNASQQQLNDALSLLNMMMGQWARRRWLILHLIDLKVIGDGRSAYTMGPGGDFVSYGSNVNWDAVGMTWDSAGLSVRASRFESAFVRMNADTQQQVDIPIAIIPAYEDYSTIPSKNIAAGIPQALFLDTGYPIATVNVWPALMAGYELHVLVYAALPRFTRLDEDINLPDEYQDALLYNLARRLLSFYGKSPDPEITAQALSSLQTVRNANLQLAQMAMPRAILPIGTLGNYNIYADR